MTFKRFTDKTHLNINEEQANLYNLVAGVPADGRAGPLTEVLSESDYEDESKYDAVLEVYNRLIEEAKQCEDFDRVDRLYSDLLPVSEKFAEKVKTLKMRKALMNNHANIGMFLCSEKDKPRENEHVKIALKLCREIVAEEKTKENREQLGWLLYRMSFTDPRDTESTFEGMKIFQALHEEYPEGGVYKRTANFGRSVIRKNAADLAAKRRNRNKIK